MHYIAKYKNYFKTSFKFLSKKYIQQTLYKLLDIRVHFTAIYKQKPALLWFLNPSWLDLLGWQALRFLFPHWLHQLGCLQVGPSQQLLSQPKVSGSHQMSHCQRTQPETVLNLKEKCTFFVKQILFLFLLNQNTC